MKVSLLVVNLLAAVPVIVADFATVLPLVMTDIMTVILVLILIVILMLSNGEAAAKDDGQS
jgi:hypothetical protein